MPTLGKRVEGTAVVSISCLQLIRLLCHRTVPPPATSVWLATLATTAIVAALSAVASFLIFLPAPDRAEDGDGKQLPCPATSLPLPGRWLRAQALQTDRLGSIPHSSPEELVTSGSYVVCLILRFPHPHNRDNGVTGRKE